MKLYIFLAVGIAAAQTEQIRLNRQLAADQQRLREAVKLPGPYLEAQRRVTDGGDPAWWHSDAGISQNVPKPWTPVAVDGNSVKVWRRTYRFTDSGLPQVIDSDSTPLLAGPVRLVAAVRGQPVEVRSGTLSVDSANNREVRLSSQSRLGSLSLEMSVLVEYEGFARFDAVVSRPKAAALDQLILEIPLRAECASHYAHDMQGVIPQSKKNPALLFESGGARRPIRRPMLRWPFNRPRFARASTRAREKGSWPS
jgi:Glycoside hydrolase 123, N-terminal domain